MYDEKDDSAIHAVRVTLELGIGNKRERSRRGDRGKVRGRKGKKERDIETET